MKTIQVDFSNLSTRTFITRVYGWMFLALLITAITSMLMAGSDRAMTLIYNNSILFGGLVVLELVLVWLLASRVATMSVQTARFLFISYSIINGITLSGILLVYTGESLASTFLVTAITFGIMSAYGYATKSDLTKAGNILMMVLVGVIIASLVNIFLKSEKLYWITTIAGLIVFTGLIAFDTQKLKRMANDNLSDSNNIAILGALTLYLDLVNLFLLLLRLFGRRRNSW